MSPPPAGLCNHCQHQQVVPAARSTFSLCRLWKQDDRFPRYPRLPVVRCAGFVQRAGAAPGERELRSA
jgi:hypothetical protein